MPNTYYTLQSGLMFHIFAGVQHAKPTGLAIGLCGPVPNNRSIIELPNQSGYARISVPPSLSNWSYQSDGYVFNNVPISFNIASGVWGWSSGVFIADSSAYSGGNVLFYNQHPISRFINTLDQIVYPVSGLSILLT